MSWRMQSAEAELFDLNCAVRGKGYMEISE